MRVGSASMLDSVRRFSLRNPLRWRTDPRGQGDSVCPLGTSISLHPRTPAGSPVLFPGSSENQEDQGAELEGLFLFLRFSVQVVLNRVQGGFVK